MKGKILIVSLIVLLGFVFGCDFVRETQTQIHTPEVFILATNPGGFIVLRDSSYQDTAGNWITVPVFYVDVIIDSVTFVSWNGVDAVINGFKVKFYIPDEDTGKLVYTSHIYGLRRYIFSSGESDTVKNTIYNIPIATEDGIDSLFDGPVSPDPHTTMRMRVIFFGKDAYGYNEDFEVYNDYVLIDISTLE